MSFVGCMACKKMAKTHVNQMGRSSRPRAHADDRTAAAVDGRPRELRAEPEALRVARCRVWWTRMST